MNDKLLPDLPERLAAKVFSDLRAVTPIRSSGLRLLAVAGVALAAAAIFLAFIGMRIDMGTLPSGAFAVMIAVRIAAGFTLVLLALKEVVPATPRWHGLRAVALTLAFGILFLSPVMFSWITGPRPDAPGPRFCWLGILAVAVPSFGGLFWMIRRGYPIRPVLTGLLAGLGSGILAEAAQFLACPITRPFHGTAIHGGTTLAVAVVGALAGLLIDVRRRRELSTSSALL